MLSAVRSGVCVLCMRLCFIWHTEANTNVVLQHVVLQLPAQQLWQDRKWCELM